MKLRPHQHFNPTRNFYAGRSEPAVTLSADAAPAPDEGFLRQLEERRTLWADRKPAPTVEQESCLAHLRDQFHVIPFPKPTLRELTAFATHPDFPAESVSKLLTLFNPY